MRQGRAAEREMEERQRERDIRLRELEINRSANSHSAISSGSYSSIQNVKFPAMHRFVDKTDYIDVGLEAFERYCVEAGVDKGKYSFLLSANLTGEL